MAALPKNRFACWQRPSKINEVVRPKSCRREAPAPPHVVKVRLSNADEKRTDEVLLDFVKIVVLDAMLRVAVLAEN